MLRLIAFSVLLSLCLPALLVSFFETVGAGSAENDRRFSSFFQSNTAASSVDQSSQMAPTAERTVRARSLSIEAPIYEDGIQSDRLSLLDVQVDESMADNAAAVIREPKIPCVMPSVSEALMPQILPISM